MAKFKMSHGNMPSLQLLCLNSIIKKFERFYFAFVETKDPRLKRNLEFLQRRFSKELACELLEDKDNTDAYFDFLFNEHLTAVDFAWFKYSVYLKSIDDIFSRLPNLLRIKFRFCTDERYQNLGDQIFKSIAKFCPRIIEIDGLGSGPHLTDKGIQYLCDLKNGELPCPELKNIVVLFTSVTHEGAECLIRSIPSIEKFAYEYLPYVLHSIYTESVCRQQTVPFFNLTELYLSERLHLIVNTDDGYYEEDVPDFTAVLETCLAVCPKLESINWRFLRNHQRFDAIINSHLRLKKLYLECTPLSFINIDNLLKTLGQNLTFLIIYDCSVSASAIAVHCPSLRKLVAVRIDFTDSDDLQIFFPSLTSCVLSQTPTVTKGFRLISSSSPKLEDVELIWYYPVRDLISNEMQNQILRWCRNPAAKRIKFDSVELTIDFLKDIFLSCDSLKWMELYLCRYDVYDPDEDLNCIAIKHPNRPVIELRTENSHKLFNQRCLLSAKHQISHYFCF